MGWCKRLFGCLLCAQGLVLLLSSATGLAEPRLALKVATYNIHGCIGRDSRLDPPRVARVLRVGAPDVVALNEVYRYTDGVSQDEELARLMGPGWHSVFGKTIRKVTADYGNAILTRLPIVSSQVWALDEFPRQERRGLLRVTVRKGDSLVHIFSTHMGLSGSMRQKNAAQMLEIMAEFNDGPCILMGDFNEVPPAAGLQLVAEAGYTDAWRAYGLLGGKTFPSRPVLRRLDYIFLGSRLAAESCYVGSFDDARIASDHRPVFATVIDADAVKDAAEVERENLAWNQDFQQVKAGEQPPGWTRSTEQRKRGDGVGTGEVWAVGNEQFWVQESSGALTYRVPVQADGKSTGAEISARIQTASAGNGWKLTLGTAAVRVSHPAGELPRIEVLQDGEAVTSSTLPEFDVDPYTWNTYTLREGQADVSASSTGRALCVYINGHTVYEGPARGDLSDLKVELSTNGGSDSCKIFVDDIALRTSSDTGFPYPPDPPPPKLILKPDEKPGSWWSKLW